MPQEAFVVKVELADSEPIQAILKAAATLAANVKVQAEHLVSVPGISETQDAGEQLLEYVEQFREALPKL